MDTKEEKKSWLRTTKPGMALLFFLLMGAATGFLFLLFGGVAALTGTPNWKSAFIFSMAIAGYPALFCEALFLLGIFKGDEPNDIGPAFTYGLVIYFVTAILYRYAGLPFYIVGLLVGLVCYIYYLKHKGDKHG